MAWQFHRPDLGEGVVQVFRRDDSPYESARFKLHGLDATAKYEVENLDGGKETRTGRELMEAGTGRHDHPATRRSGVRLQAGEVTKVKPTINL